jgi:hypothetical protein
VALGDGIKVIVSVSSGESAGEAVATGSGVALSSGLMEGLGNGLGVDVEVGFGFGFAVGEGDGDGEGDSSVDAGDLAWNGVEAASWARTRTAVANNTIPIANERMMTVFNFEADASPRASAGSRAIQSRTVSVIKKRVERRNRSGRKEELPLSLASS